MRFGYALPRRVSVCQKRQWNAGPIYGVSSCLSLLCLTSASYLVSYLSTSSCRARRANLSRCSFFSLLLQPCLPPTRPCLAHCSSGQQASPRPSSQAQNSRAQRRGSCDDSADSGEMQRGSGRAEAGGYPQRHDGEMACRLLSPCNGCSRIADGPRFIGARLLGMEDVLLIL